VRREKLNTADAPSAGGVRRPFSADDRTRSWTPLDAPLPRLPRRPVLFHAVDVSELANLQTAIGHGFRDPALLRLAMTHPSRLNSGRGTTQHNQRLEFLGDSVLGLTLTHELYQRFPGVMEGPLTKARAQLVNSRTLADLATKLDLGRYLVMSSSEERSGGRTKQSALADAYEALLGAMYLDGGLEVPRRFLQAQFSEILDAVSFDSDEGNPKGELQEMLQSDSSGPPVYTLIQFTGPDHDRVFECSVSHQDAELARGDGRSKKLAESAAAEAALVKLRAAKAQSITPAKKRS
jgi:ribonuclease-3